MEQTSPDWRCGRYAGLENVEVTGIGIRGGVHHRFPPQLKQDVIDAHLSVQLHGRDEGGFGFDFSGHGKDLMCGRVHGRAEHAAMGLEARGALVFEAQGL
jgi:hypothetical protein